MEQNSPVKDQLSLASYWPFGHPKSPHCSKDLDTRQPDRNGRNGEESGVCRKKNKWRSHSAWSCQHILVPMPSNSLTFNLIDTQAARGSTFHVEAARFEESSGFFFCSCARHVLRAGALGVARSRFVYTVIMHNGIGFGLHRIGTPTHKRPTVRLLLC